ncbi:MAG: peptide ABC transporter ATP-binding protein, partial [Clostridia bacterium]|nr:peptide ABC transporter ATP-binding protein [Clostridia bacterium]
NPLHPYTQALLASIPVPDLDYKMHDIIKGEITSPIEPKPGCRFAARCDHRRESCVGADIPLRETAPGSGHFVACGLCDR